MLPKYSEMKVGNSMAVTVSLSTKIVSAQKVLWSELQDEIVMMDVDDGGYFSVQGPSARAWKLLEEKTDIQSIRDILVSEYDVSANECENQLVDLIQKLYDRGLIEILDD